MGFTRNIAPERAVLGGLLDRLALPLALISPVLAHARAVERDSARLGLVSPGDAEHVVRRHSADSLVFALARRPEPSERWVDVGSGAGFPGLVLACCFPQTTFTLVEPLKKRAGFLELVAGDLGLANVQIASARFEDVVGPFDVAVARALAEPSLATEALLTSLRTGGQALVAVAGQDAIPPGAQLVRVEDLGNVDSPGLFSMMIREV